MSSSNATSSRRRGIVVVLAIIVVLLIVLSAFVWPGWAMRHETQTAQTQTQSSQTAQRPEKPSIDAVALPENATDLMKSLPDSVLNFARTKVETTTEWQDMSPLEEYTVTYSTGEKGHDVTMMVAQWSDATAAGKLYEQLSTTDKAGNGKLLAHGSVKVSGAQTGSYEVYELPVATENSENSDSANSDNQSSQGTNSDSSTSSANSESSDSASKEGNSDSAAKSDSADKSSSDSDSNNKKTKSSDKGSGRVIAIWQNDTVVFQITGAKEDIVDFYMKFPM